MPDQLKITTAGRACVQDLGRRGVARLGVSANGAADQFSARAANILVGNAESRKLFEILAFDFAFVTTGPRLIAATGAAAQLSIGGHRVAMWQPHMVHTGQEVCVRSITHGVRVYVSVHGGIEADELLGSSAPDPMLGFSSWVLEGHKIPIRTAAQPLDHPTFRHPLFLFPDVRSRCGPPWVVDVSPGPDLRDFEGEGESMFGSAYSVAADSDAVGLRLRGDVVPSRKVAAEIISRGVPIGAVEIPSGGEIIVLLRGRGITAGYPIPAIATTCGLATLGQVRPGDMVEFRRVSVDEAVRKHRDDRARLDQLRSRVRTAFDALRFSHELEVQH